MGDWYQIWIFIYIYFALLYRKITQAPILFQSLPTHPLGAIYGEGNLFCKNALETLKGTIIVDTIQMWANYKHFGLGMM